ncbi:protein EMBRYO DEFECTIVE 1674 [Olea europaea var. sylvestris]|uniref:protein EMBRYO DEFECTIVE 1674 n=1 Tax=Olea europaea var. sylvestris TaxID=158386 RepID=UPI000C1D0D39|nr:protein EMBRYO DEFECTIVE 1674 [Olea europaea var. sylvestris]
MGILTSKFSISGWVEVCDHFVIGFPYYWEEFAGLSFDEESTSSYFSKEISGSDGNKTSLHDSSKSFLPVAVNDLPVTVMRDLFTISPGDCSLLKQNILDDILQTYGGNATDKSPLNFKNMEAKQKRRGDIDVIDAEPRTKKNKRNTVDCAMLGIGPLTRSRTRLKQIDREQTATIGRRAEKKQKKRSRRGRHRRRKREEGR